MTTDSLLLATGALALAGFVQGLTGFGFGMTAMALLPLALGDLFKAQAVVTLTSIAACLLVAAVTVRELPDASLRLLWLGTLAGVPLGFSLLESLPRLPLTRLLGLTLCLMVLFEVVAARRAGLRLPSWLAPGVGLASGVLTGAFNVGGPPLVAYIYSQPGTKQQHVARLTAIFLSGGLIRLSLLLIYDELPPDVLVSAGWGVAPMLLAVFCGNRLLGHVPQIWLRRGVYAMLLFLGGRYLIAV